MLNRASTNRFRLKMLDIGAHDVCGRYVAGPLRLKFSCASVP